jgi:hypothetical protein
MTILQHTTSRVSVFTSPDVKANPSRTALSMDQQLIVMYLSLKGLNAVKIHNDLLATLNGEEKSYRTVPYCLCKPSFSSPKRPQPFESPAPFSMNQMKQS